MANTDLAGELDGFTFYLSPSVPAQERYQRRYVPVDIVEGGTAEDRLLFTGKGERIWEIRAWKGGEGNQHWRRGDNRYRISDGVRPNRYDDGLTLDAFHRFPTLATGGTSNAVVLAGMLDETVYLVTRQPSTTGNMYPLNIGPTGTGNWVPGTAYPTGSTEDPQTATVLGDYIYIGFADGSIRRANTAGNASVITTGAAPWTGFPPSLTAYQGQLFALGHDDLYTVTTAGVTTKVVDNNYDNSDWIAEGQGWYRGHGRMTTSDVGPVWFDRDNAGTAVVWEFNVASETADIIGQLPPFSGPTGIYWIRGTLVVSFVESGIEIGGDPGGGFLYLKSGGQESVVGPFVTDGTGEGTPLVVGSWGSVIVAYYSGWLWGYDLSTGGLFRIAGSDGTLYNAQSTFMVGQHVLVRTHSGAANEPGVEWWTLENYFEPTTYSTLHTGHFDFDQPGFPKRLIDVTVLSDDLPADTSIDVAVTVDRGTLTASDAPSSVDGTNLHAFDFSTDTHNLVGSEFELELRLDYSGAAEPAATPVIRSVFARAVSGATVREWVVAIDLNRSGEHAPTDFVDALEAMIDSHGQVDLVDPWMVREGQTPETYDVTVEELAFHHSDSGELDYAVVRLRNDDWI